MARSKFKDFDYITQEALTPHKSWSNKDLHTFHYFNENGIYRKLKAAHGAVSDQVDSGNVTTGWLLAYGSLNSYSPDNFTGLFRKSRISWRELSVSLEMLQGDIDRAYTRLAEELYLPYYS